MLGNKEPSIVTIRIGICIGEQSEPIGFAKRFAARKACFCFAAHYSAYQRKRRQLVDLCVTRIENLDLLTLRQNRRSFGHSPSVNETPRI